MLEALPLNLIRKGQPPNPPPHSAGNEAPAMPSIKISPAASRATAVPIVSPPPKRVEYTSAVPSGLSFVRNRQPFGPGTCSQDGWIAFDVVGNGGEKGFPITH